MRIDDYRFDVTSEHVSVSAAVTWEDAPRQKERLYFRAPVRFREQLSVNPNAFLVGAAIPAMYYGERRISIEGEVCPDLLDRLSVAMHILQHWYPKDKVRIPTMEARTSQIAAFDTSQRRAGLFFSGGIDSYAALLRNRQVFRESHPRYIRDAALVFGLEVDTPQAFEYVEDLLSPVAQAYALTFIPVWTNVYLMYREEDRQRGFFLWRHYLGGSSFAAIAHFLAGRIHTMTSAASTDIPHLSPYGTDPLLDPCYGSFDLAIRHEGIEMSRLQKTRLVADSPVLLEHLRVCNLFNEYRENRINCGRCEKCVRTMLALIALGKLREAKTFEMRDLQAEDVRRAVRITRGEEMVASSYAELVEPLVAAGRSDLAASVRSLLAQYRRSKGLLGDMEARVRWLGKATLRSCSRMVGRRFAKVHAL